MGYNHEKTRDNNIVTLSLSVKKNDALLEIAILENFVFC